MNLNLRYQKLLSKNNIPIYLAQRQQMKSVLAAVVVKVGTLDEVWPEEAGLSHVVEHLVLRGTKKFPEVNLLDEYLAEVGGYKKAFTDYEGTVYYGQAPYKYAERLIEVLSEIVNSFIIPKDAVSKELQVIQEEFKRKLDNPIYFLSLKARNFVFGSHPLGRNILGSEEYLCRLTRSKILNFASKYYHSNNFTIILMGNLTSKKAIKFIDKYFISEVRKAHNERPLIPLIDNGERELQFFHSVKQAQIELVAPFSFTERKSLVALKLFQSMITTKGPAALYYKIREKRGLAYDINLFIAEYYIGTFHIRIGTKPEAYRKVISLIFKAIKESKNSSLLLKKTKQRVKGRLFLTLDDPLWNFREAVQEVIHYGKPDNLQEFIKEIDSISIRDIKNVVEKVLQPSNFRRIIMLPSKK